MSPRERRDGRSKKRPGLDAQRRHLLDTAIGLFAKHGSRGVSVKAICDAADVSRPTFYRCFADKDELVEALYDEAVHGPVRSIMLASIAMRGGERGWLKGAIAQMIDAIFERADVASLLFVESSDPSSPAHEIIQRTFDAISASLGEAMERAGAPPLHPVTRKALLVACQWIVHDAIRKGLTREARQDAKDATWELANRAFLSGRLRS